MEGKRSCNILSNTVAASPRDGSAVRPVPYAYEPLTLYADDGGRKYVNGDERRRVLAAIDFLERGRALFALTLLWTGARVSEVLALTPASFQIELSIVTLRTLKRRKLVMREVPIPPVLVQALCQHFDLSARQLEPAAARQLLWPWHRTTAWRLVKSIMGHAQIAGRPACPRGLRHGFGVGALQSGIPLTLLQRWLGHARISTTAIYAAACGPEERAFAERFWHFGQYKTSDGTRSKA